MQKYDVVIIGAGPAGLRAAETLAKSRKVIVLEKDGVLGNKVCAEGITRKDLLLIPEKVIERRFNSYIGHSRLFATAVKTEKPYIFTINRKRLAMLMAQKAEKAGAKILLRHRVTAIENNYVISNNKKFYFEYLIGADGSNSIVRRHLGLPFEMYKTLGFVLNKEVKDIESWPKIYKGGFGYFSIFPNRGYAKIGICTNSRFADLKKELERFCKKLGIKKGKLESFPINYCYKGHEFGNIFLAGDAAGFASEFSGEGIYAAIVSGEDIAKRIIDKNYNYRGIKRLLEIKKRHRSLLKILTFNRFLSSIALEIFILLAKNLTIARFFKNRFKIL